MDGLAARHPVTLKVGYMDVKIVTDSTCDLPAEVVKNHDITVIPCYINLKERSYQDGVDM